MFRYGVVRLTSVLLRIGGFVGLIASLIVFAIGYQQLTTNRGGGADTFLTAGFGLLQIYGGVSLFVSALLMIAIGQMLQIFIDIALNTRPIHELVATSRSTAKFFDAMAERTQASTEQRVSR